MVAARDELRHGSGQRNSERLRDSVEPTEVGNESQIRVLVRTRLPDAQGRRNIAGDGHTLTLGVLCSGRCRLRRIGGEVRDCRCITDRPDIR